MKVLAHVTYNILQTNHITKSTNIKDKSSMWGLNPNTWSFDVSLVQFRCTANFYVRYLQKVRYLHIQLLTMRIYKQLKYLAQELKAAFWRTQAFFKQIGQSFYFF